MDSSMNNSLRVQMILDLSGGKYGVDADYPAGNGNATHPTVQDTNAD